MPLEFISENVYNGGTFELFLQRLQSNYGTIISLTQAFQDKFGTVFPNLETYLVKDNVDSLSHSFARCYTTREILKNLFGMDRWYRNPNLPSDDAIFRVVNIGGKLFPDHTFVIIQYKESVYLLQSYYYGYLLSGKYGVIKLLGDSFIELDNILEGYKNPNLQEYEIEALNRRLSFFTGIESSRHWGDLFGFKINSDGFIEDDKTYANALCVMRFFEAKLTAIEDVLFSEIGSIDDTINLTFNYLFSDAFIPEAAPGLEFAVDNSILNMPNPQELLSYLVGTDQATNYSTLGLNLGPGSHGRIRASKIITVNIRQLIDMFFSIKTHILPLIYTSRIENLHMVRSYIWISDIIILDADHQVEKDDIVNRYVSFGLLPANISKESIFISEHNTLI